SGALRAAVGCRGLETTGERYGIRSRLEHLATARRGAMARAVLRPRGFASERTLAVFPRCNRDASAATCNPDSAAGTTTISQRPKLGCLPAEYKPTGPAGVAASGLTPGRINSVERPG